MSVFVSSLPDFPEYDDYILVQDGNGDYLLLGFDNGDSVTISDNGTVHDSGGYHYTLSSDGDSWVSSGVCGGAHPFTSDGYRPIFSTVNCYDTSGTLVYSGSPYAVPFSIAGGLSSSDIVNMLDIGIIIPLAFVAVVGIIGIRKFCAFLFGLIRGA